MALTETLTFRNHARALTLIAEAAHQHGLPEPASISIHPNLPYSRISLMFDSLAEIVAWAMWAEAVIEERSHKDTIQHHTRGTIYDVPVELLYVERVAVSA